MPVSSLNLKQICFKIPKLVMKVHMGEGLVFSEIRIEQGVDAETSTNFLPASLIVRLPCNYYPEYIFISFSFSLEKFNLKQKEGS